jgi:hypothetical protein
MFFFCLRVIEVFEDAIEDESRSKYVILCFTGSCGFCLSFCVGLRLKFYLNPFNSLLIASFAIGSIPFVILFSLFFSACIFAHFSGKFFLKSYDSVKGIQTFLYT